MLGSALYNAMMGCVTGSFEPGHEELMAAATIYRVAEYLRDHTTVDITGFDFSVSEPEEPLDEDDEPRSMFYDYYDQCDYLALTPALT